MPLHQIIKDTWSSPQHILVCALNWGLGHASRLVPVIHELLSQNHSLTLASDGPALELLKAYFPQLSCLSLPSYNIKYKYNNMFFNGIVLAPHIAKAIIEEHKLIGSWVKAHKIDAIISDNRLGCYHMDRPSIYITHQLSIQSDSRLMYHFINRLHHMYIRKFKTVWVPDDFYRKLSGKLSIPYSTLPDVKFIGTQSALTNLATSQPLDVLFLLSGPEPQRSKLEAKLMPIIKKYHNSTFVIVAGSNLDGPISLTPNVRRYKVVKGHELSELIQGARIIVCRSGYSTLMDLYQLGKKAFLIPTPGQSEQKYLAGYHHEMFGMKCTNQEHLEVLDNYLSKKL